MRTLVINNPMKDHPASSLRSQLEDLLLEGYTVHPKFTCEHCKERVLADIVNEFPVYMECPKCGELHDFDKSGGNYSVSQLVNPQTDNVAEVIAAFKTWRKSAHGY